MRLQRFSLGVAGVLAAGLFSLSAHANSTGITGRSGKQGPTCMAAGCHNTNASPTAPTVTLTGPDTLTAGATGNYTLVITGGPGVKAGMNVAVSDSGGTLNKVGTDLKVIAGDGELTHTAAKAFSNNEVRFDFTLVAPSTNKTVTLYASGNSVNGDNNLTLDHSTSVTKAITITGGSTGGPDGGTPDGGTDNPGDGDEGEEGGCSCGTSGGAPMMMLLALVASRMRRRTS